MSEAIKIPAIQIKNQDWFTKQSIAVIKKYEDKYGNEMFRVSLDTGISLMILKGFMAVENTTADPTLISVAGAVGLMQIVPNTAWYTYYLQQDLLTAYELLTVQAICPELINLKTGKVNPNTPGLLAKLKEALKVPEFNILTGALSIGQLLIQSKKITGEIRLDHLIIKYNAGIGNFARYITNRNLIKADTVATYNAIPLAETRGYLVKFLGIGGTMDVQLSKT